MITINNPTASEIKSLGGIFGTYAKPVSKILNILDGFDVFLNTDGQFIYFTASSTTRRGSINVHFYIEIRFEEGEIFVVEDGEKIKKSAKEICDDINNEAWMFHELNKTIRG